MKNKLVLLAGFCLLFGAENISAQCSPAFYDSFETGSYTPTWSVGSGLTSAAVTTINPAVGSYRIEGNGGTNTHLTGISATIPSATPSSISWYIYPTGNLSTNYFVVGDNAVSATNCVVFCYWNGSANAIRFVSGSTYNYTATPGQWYHIEMRNINWTTHSFDTYINNVLCQTSSQFRSATQNSITKVHMYNFNSGVGVWDDIMIGAAPPIVLTNSSSSTTCPGGADGSIDLTVSGGTPNFTYSWSNAATTEDISGLTAGTYSVTVTDANTCTQTATFTITSPPAFANSISSTSPSCYGGTDGTATISSSGGTGVHTYLWSNASTNTTATNLAAGTYTCIVTDANNCTSTETVTITDPALLTASITQNNLSCFGGNNGDATANPSGGTGPYSYSWSTGGTAATESNLAAGTYTCTITDANSCTTTQTVTITAPPVLTVSMMQTSVSCFGGNNGDATVTVSGGTGSYSYLWSSGGNAANEMNLAAGTYSCTITDANNCILTETITITEPAALAVSGTQTNVSCNGGNTGDATVSVSGGTGLYSYSWSSGGTAANEMNLSAGTYTCTITDANNCSITETITITEPSAIASTFATDNVSCNGGNDASVTISSTGGTGPLSYLWSSGGTGTTESNLSAGTYTCTITDSSGCSVNETVIIAEPDPLNASGPAFGTTGCGASDGSISVNTNGGTPGYVYQWSNGATTEDISGIPAGSYTLTVSDTNNCMFSTQFIVSDPNPPTVFFDNVTDSLCISDAAITITGGTPAGGTYSGPGVSSGVFNPSAANAGYNVIMYSYTAANGCSASAIDSIWVDNCIGIAPAINTNEISLYPNPTDGLFFLNLNGAADGNALVEIFAIDGRMISSGNFATNSTINLSLADEAVGIYFVKISYKGEVSNVKVIRQ